MKLKSVRDWIGMLAILFGMCALCAAVRLNVFQSHSRYVNWEFEEKLQMLLIIFSGAGAGFACISFCWHIGTRKFVVARADRLACFGLLLVAVACLDYYALPSQRAHPRGTAANACISNLRAIDGAKQVWGMEHKMTADAVPSERDLTDESQWKETKRYFKKLPECPLHGTYVIGPLSTGATCSIQGHHLP